MSIKNDGWAFVPEDGRPPRLVRYTTLLGGLLAEYHHDKNLVVVDKGYYDTLDAIDQGRVLATHTSLHVAVRGERVCIA